MQNDSYTLHMPLQRRSSAIFASPHSGRSYGWAFLQSSILDEWEIRSSEDAYVDKLFQMAPEKGAALLTANMPRAYVDLNRGADELDPALVRGVRRPAMNARITSGLGVIPRVVAGARPIYRGKMTFAEAQARLEHAWYPYHAQLRSLLTETRAMFGEAVLIDCHSMPREAVRLAWRSGQRPEVVLGDRHGASASAEIMDRVAAAFENSGFVVARNTPFAGAYIAQQYGRPSRRQHVVQVEIDRSLYMNEARVRPNGQFHTIQSRLTQVIEEICHFGEGCQKLAAE